MKNLKKVLSLALAFAMVLGLCVTGMAAQDVTTLSDWDEVTDKDAATLLNAFNIMQGDEDGFRPNDSIKRSEAAKMIAVAMWGGADNEPLYHSGNVGAYTDVEVGAWYMGYVNYVTAVGIMTGKNLEKGTFDPDGNVTGYELLKMCLVALGYDPSNSEHGENLLGAGWDTRTMVLATTKLRQSLIEGTTVTAWAAPLDRMNAAIIIKNMINREMVGYNDDGTVYVTKTFAEEILGMTVKTGTLVGNEYGTYVNGTVAGNGITDDAAKEGKNVEIYYIAKDATVGEIIETTLTSELLDLGTPVRLYYAGDEIVSASLTGWASIAPSFDKDWNVTNWDDAPSATTYATGTLAYKDETCADFDGDNKIDLWSTQTYTTIAKVTAVIETENFGTVYQLGDAKWNTKNDKADTDFPAGNFIQASESNIDADEGDYIVFSTVKNVFDANYTYGHVLTPVEGEVTRVVVGNNGTTYHIDGTPYAGTADATGISFGKEGTFYTYPDSKIAVYVPVEGEEAVTTYAVLYDAGFETYGSGTGLSSTTGVVVEVMAILQDGTVGTYEVNSITVGDGTYLTEKLTHSSGTVGKMTGTKKDGSAATEIDFFLAGTGELKQLSNKDTTPLNYLVTYTLTEDGKMNITDVVKTFVKITGDATTKKVTSGVATIKTDDGDKFLTAGTVNFVQTQTEGVAGKAETWAVYTGTATPTYEVKGTVNAVEGNLYTETDGDAVKVTVLEAEAFAFESTTSTASFYYVIKNGGQIGATSDGKAIYELTVYDTETNEVEVVESITGTTGFYTTYSNDTTAYGGGLSTPEYGFIDSFEGNLLNLVDVNDKDEIVKSTIVEVNKDTKYYLIDGEDTTEITAGDISAQMTVADTLDDATTPRNEAKDTYQAIVTADNLVIVFADAKSR